jgi:hypothetical protein
MIAKPLTELQRFHEFVGEKVKGGDPELLPEDVMDEWRELNGGEKLSEEDIAAIQEALDELDRGDPGMSMEEFDQQLRAEFNLPPRQ